ncbi:MAG: squalene synthase HpnC [Verrucomicrobiota bacterium]
MELHEAYQHCTYLARHHYENFPVGRLVPKAIRPHVHAVYAFARTADDIADEGYIDPRSLGTPAANKEVMTQNERLAAMHSFQTDLEACVAGNGQGRPEHDWIFIPLADTIRKFELPPQLFRDLLSAFEQDIVKTRYQSFDEVTDYCKRSANPIGRLVLLLHGYREAKLHEMSDHICTGLQLANFWQDVSIDLGKDRIYIPIQDQERNGISEKTLFSGDANPGYISCMQDMVERAWTFFRAGRNLPRYLHFPLNWEIRLTWLGGTKILKKIEEQDFNTLLKRPKLRKRDFISLVPYALFSR